MRAGLLGRVSRVAAAFRVVTVTPMPARRGVAPLADVPDRQRRDGPPQLVVRTSERDEAYTVAEPVTTVRTAYWVGTQAVDTVTPMVAPGASSSAGCPAAGRSTPTPA